MGTDYWFPSELIMLSLTTEANMKAGTSNVLDKGSWYNGTFAKTTRRSESKSFRMYFCIVSACLTSFSAEETLFKIG